VLDTGESSILGLDSRFRGNDGFGANALYYCPRKIQLPTSQQMEMEVENDLAATPLYIEEQPIARLSNG
jgi:hypothetical protein